MGSASKREDDQERIDEAEHGPMAHIGGPAGKPVEDHRPTRSELNSYHEDLMIALAGEGLDEWMAQGDFQTPEKY